MRYASTVQMLASRSEQQVVLHSRGGLWDNSLFVMILYAVGKATLRCGSLERSEFTSALDTQTCYVV